MTVLLLYMLLHLLPLCWSDKRAAAPEVEDQWREDTFDALMSLYSATGGKFETGNSLWEVLGDANHREVEPTEGPNSGWLKHANWGAKRVPFNQWYGLQTDEMGHVTQLELYNNNLQGSMPVDELLLLPHVGYVDLCFNNLTKLPDTIGALSGLTALTELHISANSFQGTIPDSIGDLTSLHKLRISYACLTGSIPESIGRLKQLTALDLSENDLSGKVPRSLRNLTRLNVLYVNHNPRLRAKEKVVRNMLPRLQWLNV